MDKYNEGHKAVLDDMLLKHPGVRAGHMFGYPAYYAGEKLSICLYENGVGVKVPEATAKQLLESDMNVVPFQPLGRRKMREWIQVNLSNSEDYRGYLALFEESIQYVLRLQGKTG
jgi:hypothetical protein